MMVVVEETKVLKTVGVEYDGGGREERGKGRGRERMSRWAAFGGHRTGRGFRSWRLGLDSLRQSGNRHTEHQQQRQHTAELHRDSSSSSFEAKAGRHYRPKQQKTRRKYSVRSRHALWKLQAAEKAKYNKCGLHVCVSPCAASKSEPGSMKQAKSPRPIFQLGSAPLFSFCSSSSSSSSRRIASVARPNSIPGSHPCRRRSCLL